MSIGIIEDNRSRVRRRKLSVSGQDPGVRIINVAEITLRMPPCKSVKLSPIALN